MEKRSKRRRNSEEIQDLGLDLDEEIIDEEDEAEEDLEVEIEEVEEDSIDSDFREMPKVRIDADTGNNGHKHLSSQKGSNQNLKWVLVCILCIVLGVVIYGGYKVFFSGNEAGNTTTQNAVVQVISEDTMVAIPLELTPMIDGSIPMAVDTKQRVDANVILYYYGEVSQEIQNEIARLGLDVSGYHLDTYWHPNDLNVAY